MNSFRNSLDLPFQEGAPSKEKVFELKKWLKANSDKYQIAYVTLFHGASKSASIEEEGLKPTSPSRRRSYQSTSGYVYLAPTPERAKMFGDLANQSKSDVYAVTVRVIDLKADSDQLANQRAEGADVGNSVAESIVYGGSVRVRGRIEPWQVRKLDGMDCEFDEPTEDEDLDSGPRM